MKRAAKRSMQTPRPQQRTAVQPFRRLTLLALCGISMTVLGATRQNKPNERPTTRVTDCTESGCHAEQTRFKFMHAPTGVGACEACHVVDDPAKHTFKLIVKQDDEPICSFCHIGKSTFGRDDNWAGRHVHDPVKQGDCVACHNPHGSNMRNLINADSVSQMCASCHDNILGHAHAHPPVGERECLNCHQPHSGDFPKLLHQVGRDLCLRCHADVMPKETAVGQGLASTISVVAVLGPHPIVDSQQPKATIHEPVLGECTQCHNPHGSAHNFMLKQNLSGLCTSCHQDVAEMIAHATIPHTPVMDDRACLNCHEAHHSKTRGLLQDRDVSICLDCHNKPVKRADGTTVAAIGSLTDKSLHAHGPVADAKCTDCHNVHGGNHPRLLVGQYSEKFYQPFSAKAYELCFSCHDQNLATQQHTTSATNFRNGERNLHFVHIMEQGETGRSCRMCHAEHVSKQPHMLRDSVPYGQWTLPIKFTASDSGGTCGAGCHRGRSYDRDNPVPADAMPATPAPATSR